MKVIRQLAFDIAICAICQLAAVRVQLNQVRDELEECVQKQEFQRAAELKQEVTRLEASRQALVVQSEPQNTETRMEKVTISNNYEQLNL